LGKKLGSDSKTFSGLAGLGDLVTTCISPYSRNRFLGEEIGKGKLLKDILKKMKMTAEGIYTVKSAYRLSLKYKIDMPITKQVYNVLYRNQDPYEAVQKLMLRERKQEFY
jgi:glycerol-3-phosphate dehydrogenase (NAD(P)+)